MSPDPHGPAAAVHAAAAPPTAAPPDTAPRPVAPPAGTLRRVFRVCASLPLAIGLLSAFAACLATATLIESAYGAALAGELVYRAWWFAALLAALAVNVVCAALKKYPWRRHQAGFLVTHAGLLVLLFGGLLTSLYGVEGRMSLIDSEDAALQRTFRLSNAADAVQLADRQRLEVFRVPDQPTPDHPAVRGMTRALDGGEEVTGDLARDLAGHYWSAELSPGSLAWHADEHHQPRTPALLRVLQRLADPFPGLRCDLDAHSCLTVHNYYPHTEQWPFGPAAAGEPGFAALRLQLSTPVASRPLDRWVTSKPSFERDPLPVGVELFQLTEPALLPEFLAPPPPPALGTKGQLVLLVGPRRTPVRFDLDRVEAGKPVAVGDTGLTLTLKKSGHLLDLLGHEGGAPKGGAPFPAVQFELAGSGGSRGTYLVCARLPQLPPHQDGDKVAEVAGWLHEADPRRGEANKVGVLQLLQTPDGKVYQRAFGKDGLKEPGSELDVSDPAKCVALPWQPLEMRLRVLTYLPHATKGARVVPRDVAPGVEPAEPLPPALRASLSVEGKTEEFWVRLGRQPTRVRVGDALYLVRYRPATRPVAFKLKLKGAEQVNDPGTGRAAHYESRVLLTESISGGTKASERTISMNNTLSADGWKVYQTKYQPLTDPQSLELVVGEDGRLVSMSGLTAARDPGLGFKYAGSGLVVLGIALMFWMRAYFFRSAVRSPQSAVRENAVTPGPAFG